MRCSELIERIEKRKVEKGMVGIIESEGKEK